MASENILTEIQRGMVVCSADNIRLGTIRQIWYGSDPRQGTERCDEEVCSRLEVHHKDGTTYISSNTIAEVSLMVVTLTLDAATVHEKAWSRPPVWIAAIENNSLDSAGLAKVGAPHVIG